MLDRTSYIVKLLTILILLSSCVMRGKIIVTAYSKLSTSGDGKPHITSIAVTGTLPVTTNPAIVNVIFNEDVTGLSSASFVVTNGSINSVTGSGSSYSLNIAPTTDGPVSVKLISEAVSNLANEKNDESNPYSFTYTTSSVVALLNDTPAATSTETAFAVTVSGNNVTRYRYKMGPAASLDCTQASGYSSFVLVANVIIDDFTDLEDTLMKICVQGRDSVGGIDQPLIAATEYTWNQHSPTKISFSQSSIAISEDETNPVVVTWNLSHKKATDVTFTYNYTGSALLGVDHNLTYGNITIPAGQLSASTTFSTFGNMAPGPDLFLNLSVIDVTTDNAILGERKTQNIIFRDNDSGSLKNISTFAFVTEKSNCVIYTGGDLYCWGNNSDGEVGNNTSLPVITPTLIGTGFSQVALSKQHACAIKMDGSLYCWGNNTYGQLGRGVGNTTGVQVPTLIDSGVSYSQIAVGRRHTCGITTGKKLKCWGRNNYGQLGDATTTNKQAPTPIDATSNYAMVSVGEDFTCAIKDTSNDLFCWGTNLSYNLGRGDDTGNETSPLAIDVGETYKYVSLGDFGSCGITTNDELKCWGPNYGAEAGVDSGVYTYVPTVVDSGVKYSQVKVGGDYTAHACGITLTGILKCWGSDYGTGALGLGPSFAGNYTQVTTPQIMDSGVSYSSVYVAADATCGVTSGGEFKCWGYVITNFINGALATTTPTSVLNEKTFTSASIIDNVCALGSDEYVYCTRAIESNFFKVDRNYKYKSVIGNCGLRYDNAIVCYLDDVPFDISAGMTFKFFTTNGGGWSTYCGIDANDDLYCWGLNFAGQVGNNTTTDAASPVHIDAGTKYKFVHTGGSGTCGITLAGRVKCWGEAPLIGDNDALDNLTPVFTNDVTTYSTLSVGSLSVCGITTGNKLKCWGYQTSGQLGNGVNSATMVTTPTPIDSSNDYVQVSLTNAQACAIDSNDHIKCWGDNKSNLFAAPDNILGTGSYASVILTPTIVDGSNTYKSILAKENRFCAITSNDHLKCWGQDAWMSTSKKLPFAYEQYFPTLVKDIRHP